MKHSYFKLLLFLFFLPFCVNGQITNAITYDFTDGSIITAKQSPDAKLTLVGDYKHHGTTYGLQLKFDQEINIAVDGSCTIRFVGSKHSSLNMMATVTTAGDLGEHDTKVINDLQDTYDFVYSGLAATLNFKTVKNKDGVGSDVYLPSIQVIPTQLGKDFTTSEKNIAYSFDLRDESIIPSVYPGNVFELGLFKIDAGCCNAYSRHGNQHGINYKSGNKITLKVAGNSKIRLGGDQYSGGTITATSTTGIFDITTQNHQTATTYSDDSSGPWVDFIYVGTEGTVTLEAGGSSQNYLPFIEISPIPFDVNLTPWIQKTGTVTINGTQIDITSGADESSNATVSVSAGAVFSATNQLATLEIDLSGNALSTYTPTFTGDIASATINNDEVTLSFSDTNSDPVSYKLKISDSSVNVSAVAGQTYTYNFYDGTELPQTSYSTLRYASFQTSDKIVKINSNTADVALQFGYHDATHGGVFFSGNSFDIKVAGNAIVTFIVDQYGGANDAILEFTDSNSTVLGSIAAQNIVAGVDAFASSFSYTGAAGTITATLKSANFASAEIYIHGLSIENSAAIATSNGKIDVWDFGAEQLDADQFNNKLDVSTINSWYDSGITAGSSGNVFPSFTSSVLSWIGGGNDRLRTSNTNVTRYDENLSSVEGYTGRIYVNGGGATGRYMSLTLSEDDEVSIAMLTQNGTGNIHFEYVANPTEQNDKVAVGATLQEVKFVAKAAGTYHIYDDTDKPSYYRIERKDAIYKTLTGSVDISAASNIPNNYAIEFKNTAGKVWSTSVSGGTYSLDLPQGFTYELSLKDANGYVISSASSINITEAVTTFDITIIQVELYTVTGTISGLGSSISNLVLTYTSDASANKVFIPEAIVDANAGTYSVVLEPNVIYTITAEGVNDFTIPANTITIGNADETNEIIFEAKPVYNVAISASTLTSTQLGKLIVTFTNLNETGYSYNFTDISTVTLRDGVYTVLYDGLDEYPIELALTSNLTVAGENTSKELNFKAVKNWSFDDKVITSSTPFYKGLGFTGVLKNEIAKGHIYGVTDDIITVPLNPGEKMIVTYYYVADFSIDGGSQITTTSGSTSTFETTEFMYTGSTAGVATINIASATYITNIAIETAVAYTPTLTVGTDKDYQTINGALNAISSMVRPNDERVTVLIDAGNYEEMVVINSKNVTLKNASSNPSIALTNKGVDIDAEAVRITSYYGYGYHYYSQGTDNKWNADVLAVNKANGSQPYNNVSGSTNGSYWNATLVVFSEGFIADNLIIENSFNQYISKKESEDVVVLGSGNKGTRPTTIGSTAVQDRGFVERAAAIGIANNTDKVILNNCRIVGRQDSFYGGSGSRVVIYKGAMMGAVDYIFGGMTAVFYKTDFVLNTSDVSSDAAYITAAQQSSERGFLMYECTVKSAVPGVETASANSAKPGYFGRPWLASTSEVVFYNTTIDESTFPGNTGQSLISPLGWTSSLGGESTKMYEYGTTENAPGVDNSNNRASWSTVLTTPTLTDGTVITTFNFTKGTDNWDPISELNTLRVGSIDFKENTVNVKAYNNSIYITNVKSDTNVKIYSITGALIKDVKTNIDTNFGFKKGFFIISIENKDGKKITKLLVH
ncbi:pectinesterase family protein [uncultured Polaribacter sp.]|uniref:pectinesterase family protein n=1 Tax=uncultured Polaribacter sp. TaxID=174711 RepID=UPI0030DCC96A|tara:strand:- start:27557 stop:32392 length:4836 start_codon:yes stop_codon:yes gene_type:complete